jgi:glycosyltransferase involved in cell wall biosynthesis
MDNQNKSIAILIPCYNEELTIGKVVADFRRVLPLSKIYVFDNQSTDKTEQVAKESGAIVIKEKKRGKGYVIQAMFQKISADYYIIIDGDDTYPVENAKDLLDAVMNDQADIVVGNRLNTYNKKAFRTFHVIGNYMIRMLVNVMFNASLKDIMSGYRAMNHEVVNGIVITSRGFEVETEMTLQCLNKGFVIEEISIPYRERPQGSYSKLRTLSDGCLVLKAILIIFRDYKPLLFFGLLSVFFLIAGVTSGTVVIREFLETRYITHIPLAILSVGLVLSSLLALGIGLILDSIKNRFDEIYSFMRRKRGFDHPIDHLK